MAISRMLIVPAIVFAVLALPIYSQTTDMEYALTRHKGNKIVLLGEWRSSDIAAWREIIDSDGIYEHGFTLLDRAVFTATDGPNRNFRVSDINAFEFWFFQRFGIGSSARWVALDLENKLIASGLQTPTAKELDQLLEQKGIKSPLRKIRDFLRENPDHIDAKTDLLKEVRRRALHVMPADITEDMDDEIDLRTWAVLAAETDRVFSGSWLGIDPAFFLPHKEQPERFSKLMKNVTRRHIPQVESALRQDITNIAVWNIWAWMARSLPDYKWDTFINSLDLYYFPIEGISCPPADVCVWIVAKAMANSDWNTVIRFARQATSYTRDTTTREVKWDWVPPGAQNNITFGSIGAEPIEGYPMKSAYIPLLEALLRTGNIDGANDIYDEIIITRSLQATGHAMAVAVAKSVGMEELAAQWEQGQRMSKEPYLRDVLGMSRPFIRFFGDLGSPTPPDFQIHKSEFGRQFNELLGQLPVRYGVASSSPRRDIDTLGWKADDPERWALFSINGKLLAHDTAVPDVDTMMAILKRNGIESAVDYFRTYLAEHGNIPGIECQLAYMILARTVSAPGSSSNPDLSQVEAHCDEAAIYLRRLLNSPETMINLPTVTSNPNEAVRQSQALKSLSGRYLTIIESLLERKPSQEYLWDQWLFWRSIEGAERSLETMAERIKHSPLHTRVGDIFPRSAMNSYYEECRKNGSWSKVIGLLKTVWDREIADRIEAKKKTDENGRLPQGVLAFVGNTAANFGNAVGIPLIEAYLHDNRPGEAEEIFNAWLEYGKFDDVSKIVELAREKGYERLARLFEEKAAIRE